MIRRELMGGWEMRPAETVQWMEARVPGSVYTDLLRNQKMKDPYWKDQEDDALALMDKDYEYCCQFDCQKDLLDCDRILLHFDGIDTLAAVFVNGRLIGNASNMHRIWEWEVKELLKPGTNMLHIRLFSPLRYIRKMHERIPTRGSEDAMDGFMHIRKAHYMFGWDWGAHLPDAGIFRPVFLLGIQGGRIKSVELRQEHTFDAVKLYVRPEMEFVEESGGEYRIQITDPEGNRILAENSPECVEIRNPQLWWPNGLGEQPLYTVCVEWLQDQKVVDQWERKIGLRTIRLRREKDQWGESFAHEVNGQTFFAMGADYIPEDHLLGKLSRKRTRTLLEDCAAAHFNTVRVWGGGFYPQDWFYDLCDELGLMVWQDFMFACSMYELTPDFEANILAEFEDNIRRIRHHACLALWCGNNEMEQFVSEGHHWISKPSEIRDYYLMYERILPQVTKRLDPNTPYWPASPSSGGCLDEPNAPDRGDVHYWAVWHGNKPFTEYRNYFFRYVSEFGFQSFPHMRTIQTFTNDPGDWNIFSYIMERHQRNRGANGKIMSYLQQMYLYPTSFETLLYASQLLQADAIRYGVEHFRRNRGRCMGAIYWQLNDCWPVASWSSIDYCGRWKALHCYAKRFFAPVLLSCEEESWLSQEADMNRRPFSPRKSIRLNVSNETRQNRTVMVCWQKRSSSGTVLEAFQERVEVPAMSAVWLEKTDLPGLDEFNQYVSYQALENECILSEGTVLFTYPKYFRFLNPGLRYEIHDQELIVRADAYAKSVEIQNENQDLVLSDNLFDMNAGVKRLQVIRGSLKGIRMRSIYEIR